MTDMELAELLETDPWRAFGLSAGATAPMIHGVYLDLCTEHPCLRPALTRAREELLHNPHLSADAARLAERLAGQISNCWGPHGLDLVSYREIAADVRQVLLDRAGSSADRVTSELATRYQRKHDNLLAVELALEELREQEVVIQCTLTAKGDERTRDVTLAMPRRCRNGWVLRGDDPFGDGKLLIRVEVTCQAPLALIGPSRIGAWRVALWLAIGFLGYLCVAFVLAWLGNLQADLGWDASIWASVLLPEIVLLGLAGSAFRRRLGRPAAFGASLAASTALVFAAVEGTALMTGRRDLGLWSLPVVGLLIWAAPRLFYSLGGPGSPFHRAIAGLSIVLPGVGTIWQAALGAVAAAFWVWATAWAAWFGRGWMLPADAYAAVGMAVVALMAVALPRPWTKGIAWGGPAHLALYWYHPTPQLGESVASTIWSRLPTVAIALLALFSVGPWLLSIVYRLRGRDLIRRSATVASETAAVWVLLVFPVIWGLGVYAPRRMPDSALVAAAALGRVWHELLLGAIRTEFSEPWRAWTAHLIGSVALGLTATTCLLKTSALGTTVGAWDPEQLRWLLWTTIAAMVCLKGVMLPLINAQSRGPHPFTVVNRLVRAADFPAAVALIVWCFAPGAAIGTFVVCWAVVTGLLALLHEW